MKKKFLWIVVAIVFVGLIFGLILWQKKRDARPFVKYDFPESISVTNGTGYRADTIAMVLAHKIFNFDTLDIRIFYLPDHISDGDIEFYGIAQQLPFGDHKYLILLGKNMSLSKVKLVMSHEFVHIDQYESGRLEISGKNYIWEGDPGVFEGYDTRAPFEVEAFTSQAQIKRELNRSLYN